MRPLYVLIAASILLLAPANEATAQSDRFVGVRKDSSNEVVLFAIDAVTGLERKIATLQPAEAGVQLLGITSINARRGTFSYVYADRAAGKEFLHTVSVINGLTVSRIALPADISGLEIVAEGGRSPEMQAESEALRRRVDALEQEVRRLQSQVNQVRSR
jgi:hypothetical protein